MSTFHIEDWTGKEVNLNGKKTFNSFEEARGEINEFADWLVATAVKNGKYKADSKEAEDARSGICEDLYAVRDLPSSEEIHSRISRFTGVISDNGDMFFSTGDERSDYDSVLDTIETQGYWAGNSLRYFFDDELNLIKTEARSFGG